MKTSRILFNIGNALFILIGVLHTVVHYMTLTSAKVKADLSAVDPIILSTRDTSVWNLWEGQSFMMGILLIIVGLLNIFNLKELGINAFPPKFASIITMILLVVVIYSGFAFFGNIQVYGGLVGLGLYGASIWLSK